MITKIRQLPQVQCTSHAVEAAVRIRTCVAYCQSATRPQAGQGRPTCVRLIQLYGSRCTDAPIRGPDTYRPQATSAMMYAWQGFSLTWHGPQDITVRGACLGQAWAEWDLRVVPPMQPPTAMVP